jgi:type II secretion system protein J
LRRRGFTLVEVIVATVITAFVIGSVSTCLAQIGRVKSTTKLRLDAFHRADVALNAIRRDIVSIVRTDDLFFTRLLLFDDMVGTPVGDADRDELLIFNTRLREIHPSDYTGEGIEYETQIRIEEDDYGPILWQRRDVVPDEFPLGGGVATPLVEGVVSLLIEVYDGEQWFQAWDSDEDGLPLAVRVTVSASGHRPGDDVYDAPIAVLRTVIPIDRVLQPKDHFEAELQAILAEQGVSTGDETAGLEELPPGVEINVQDLEEGNFSVDPNAPGNEGGGGPGGGRGGGRGGGGGGGGGNRRSLDQPGSSGSGGGGSGSQQ